MASRLKSNAMTMNVQSQDQLIAAIARVGELQREQLRMTADADDRITDIRQALGHGIEPLTSEIDALRKAIHGFCEANRDRLTDGGKSKSAAFTTGEIQWRKRPPSVTVRAADAVIETLRKLGLGRFVREKSEVNKEAVLAEPDAVRGIAGLTINPGLEDFVVVPYDSADVAEAA